MRIPAVGHRREMRVNMTPMIDVVFLLIIFFLVSSHLARQESQLPLPLPTAESGQETTDSGRDRVVVNVTAEGSLKLSGRDVSTDELSRRLANEVAGSRELEVRIRSDRNVPFQHIQPVLRAVSGSGVSNVTFAVTARRQSR